MSERTVVFNGAMSSKEPQQQVVDLPPDISVLVAEFRVRFPGKVFAIPAEARDRDSDVMSFLANMSQGQIVRAAIHFQNAVHRGIRDDGMAESVVVDESLLEVATMVADIRLDLTGAHAPSGTPCCRLTILGVPEVERSACGPRAAFWSPFILAIARVRNDTPLGVAGYYIGEPFDSDGTKFVRIVEAFHI